MQARKQNLHTLSQQPQEHQQQRVDNAKLELIIESKALSHHTASPAVSPQDTNDPEGNASPQNSDYNKPKLEILSLRT